jgi:SNF2 family DNA or RNA helicase
LIVVKKSLVQNWHLELREHCFIRPAQLTLDKRKNFHVFNGPARLIVTNYEVLKAEEKRMQLFLKTRDIGIILDESAKIKNPESQLTQTFFRLSEGFKRKVIMTGTPIANRPYDIWAQIFFLDQGKSLGVDFAMFKKGLDLTNDMVEDSSKQEQFEDSVGCLYEKIAKFCVRETKNSGIITLPEKIYKNIETDWEPLQFEKYEQVRRETKLLVVKEGIPKEDISSNHLKRLLRLIQIASNPHIIDQYYRNTPGKLPFLEDLLYQITLKNEKCIVWSNFIEGVEFLFKHFKEYKPVRVHGKLDIIQRNRFIERFKKEKSTKVLFATPGAAKEGLTLTMANHVIYYDRGFSLDDYLQSQDRIHRISQEKTCYIYNLIMKDSVDEWVDALLNAKLLAAQLGQNDISLEYFRSQISYDFGDIIKGILKIE